MKDKTLQKQLYNFLHNFIFKGEVHKIAGLTKIDRSEHQRGQSQQLNSSERAQASRINEFVIKAVEDSTRRLTVDSDDNNFALLEELEQMNEKTVEEAQQAQRKQESPYTLD